MGIEDAADAILKNQGIVGNSHELVVHVPKPEGRLQADVGEIAPRETREAREGDGRRALLYAPPPAPAKPYVALLAEIEGYLRRTAAEAGFSDPEHVAEQLFLLVPGTITTASARGSAEPVRAARSAALNLLASAGRL